MQFMNKVVDMPVVVQRLVPMVQTVQKPVEVQYIGKLVNVLVVQVVQFPELRQSINFEEFGSVQPFMGLNVKVRCTVHPDWRALQDTSGNRFHFAVGVL